MTHRSKLALVVTVFLLMMLIVLPGPAEALTTHERIAGANRFETAVEISQAGWVSSETVILARSDDFCDALVVAPLAHFHSAPILITRPGSLHPDTAAEIERLGASKVIILGGTVAISQAVEDALKLKGLTVQRIGGTNRYETAALIAAELPVFSQAVIAYGRNFPDALAIGPYAARNGWPILLTETNSLPAATLSALSGVTDTIIVGGTAAVSSTVEALLPSPTRLSGANRYATAAAINNAFEHSRERAYIVTGNDFADALTGSALAAKHQAPLLLVRKTSVPTEIIDLIRYNAYPHFCVLGGEGVISSSIYPNLQGIEHIILRVVYVTTDWSPFSNISGWPAAAPIKDAHGVKYYDAAIWEDGLRVHLYALPNDYDESYGYWEGLSQDEIIAYRESFCIYSQAGMPAEHLERGEFIMDTFSEIAEELVDRHPYASHNLIYSGHGIWGGELFELHMNPVQAKTFLGNWHSALLRPLGFVDMGTVCLKGSYQDLDTFFPHTNYYIGTDRLSGCANFNVDADYWRSNVDYHYPRILGAHADMEDALRERIQLTGLRYEDSAIHIIADEIMQSCYLYSSSAFQEHKDDLATFMNSLLPPPIGPTDIRSTLVTHSADPALIAAFDSIILEKVDTKAYFTWPQEWNGMVWLTMD